MQVETLVRDGRMGKPIQHARRRFMIAMREPFYLPDDKIELPSPEASPGPPPTISLVSTILPPVMMMAVMLIYARLSPSADIRIMILMPMMSMAFPIANLIGYSFKKREYKKKLSIREQNYRAVLDRTREKLIAMAKQQCQVLDREYPSSPALVKIALGQTSRRRLWWRRPADPDFLSLRMGTGAGRASFSVSLPKISDPNEPLIALAQDLINAFQGVQGLPSLLDLKKAGSLAIASKSDSNICDFTRRLILDLIIHHSPQDVQVVALSDTEEGRARWEWLRWAPHTQAIHQDDRNRRLAFDPVNIDRCLEWLQTEYNRRTNPEPGIKTRSAKPAIVVLLDDAGSLRQSGDIRHLANSGRDADIYLIFVGGRYWPRECRSRIDVADHQFTYIETWAGERNDTRIQGDMEPASLPDCERVGRALAGLEVASGESESELPESVRLFDLLDAPAPSQETISHNWHSPKANHDLLHFSFGFKCSRKGLEDASLNLLPEEMGGIGAYHTILVGTTGSGKSEFMKSLVLTAAYRYSPGQLNFFFMDFKGGAAFNFLKDLPHVVGVVTNLGPELVERGLSAMEAEINRRQKWFADEGVQNIWTYNARHPDKPMPHLLLLLDEFARGIEEFPSLPVMLDKLVRLGRSLGMYLLLANQDVNAAVDRLLNNVGWRIALKVARQEEMHIIERALPIPRRPGQGYLLSTNNDPIEFQAAYAGFPVADSQQQVQEAFKIFKVGSDGRWQLIHSTAPQAIAQERKTSSPLEQDHLIDMIKRVARNVMPAHPIYLDPLAENIPLELVLQESAVQRAFTGTWNWGHVPGSRLVAPIGYLDVPQECLQEELEIDFDDQDGHLWIVGSPGSGKAMILETLLLSLALTHTPEEVHFYILDFGSGRLLKFEPLPHTGAVIRTSDPDELLNRLLDFLDREMDSRSAQHGNGSADSAPRPAIFLVINNFAEMRTQYPDQADRVSRYARDGNAVGLHLVVTTNRRIELSRLSIARRIVLRLANRDDYLDAVGKSTVLPASRAEGRGLWVVDRQILECQIAQPLVALTGRDGLQDARSVCESMQREWRGEKAHSIGILPTNIPLDALLAQMGARNRDKAPVPVGLSFETLELIAPPLLLGEPRWLVLGPRGSGKSNFLACIARAILAQETRNWDLYYFCLRRSPLAWALDSPVHVAKLPEEVIQACEQILEFAGKPIAETENSRKLLLLIDDLGGAFEAGKENLSTALNTLALKSSSCENVYLIAAGMADDLNMYRMSSPLVKSLKQSRTGVNFSKDPNDMDWFGAQVPLEYRRMVLPPGRGFWINRGNAILVQAPWAGSQKTE